jgi:uncharacterized integral membrane protein
MLVFEEHLNKATNLENIVRMQEEKNKYKAWCVTILLLYLVAGTIFTDKINTKALQIDP